MVCRGEKSPFPAKQLETKIRQKISNRRMTPLMKWIRKVILFPEWATSNEVKVVQEKKKQEAEAAKATGVAYVADAQGKNFGSAAIFLQSVLIKCFFIAVPVQVDEAGDIIRVHAPNERRMDSLGTPSFFFSIFFSLVSASGKFPSKSSIRYASGFLIRISFSLNCSFFEDYCIFRVRKIPIKIEYFTCVRRYFHS